MAASMKQTKDISTHGPTNSTYPSSVDMKYKQEDRPTTTESIKLQIISENGQTLLTTDGQGFCNSKSDQSIRREDKPRIVNKFDQKQINSSQILERQNENKADEIDAILARKMSSVNVNKGDRLKNKPTLISVVEEEPKWRDIGEYEDLRRTKCRRLHSKLGKSKDLALFYRAGKFYAMEAWCSHMGGPLFEGDIEEHKGSCHVMCPWHAYMFELTTGRSDIGLHQQVYPVKCEKGRVFVEYTSPLALYPYL